MSDYPALLGRGLTITRARVRPDFSEVLVFWVSRATEEEEVVRLLEENVVEIRRAMIEFAGLGQIPKLTFVLDLEYRLQEQMSQLYRDLDTGPEDFTEVECDKLWQQLEDLTLETDCNNLRRENIVSNLRMGVSRKMATHRYSGNTVEEYTRLYRQTLHKDDGESKTFVKNNVTKFLRERSKMKLVTVTSEGSTGQ